MIKGIGIDIIEISRIEKAILRNEKFLDKVFSSSEKEYIKSRNYSKCTVAGLFSAKESISKALGTGIRGFDWTDIEILHDELGKPLVTLKCNAKKIALQGEIKDITLSISHDKEKAISIALAEGEETKELGKNTNYNEVKDILIKRSRESYKGTYGRVGVVAGSKGMSGAPFLTSSSALRTGSGLVYTVVPESISQVLEIKSVEAIVKSFDDKGRGGFISENIKDIIDYLNKLDVVALGPGLGVDEDRVELVREIVVKLEKPVVIDADGLNCLSMNKEILLERRSSTILTPHVGEFERLIGVNIKDIESNREHYSMEFAKTYGVILVLKGPNTIVCDGKEIYENFTGNPGMATAGSGDVLTGLITSLLGQGISAFKAAKLGVYLHGLSGDIAKEEKGEYGLIASDIIDAIPFAIKQTVEI